MLHHNLIHDELQLGLLLVTLMTLVGLVVALVVSVALMKWGELVARMVLDELC